MNSLLWIYEPLQILNVKNFFVCWIYIDINLSDLKVWNLLNLISMRLIFAGILNGRGQSYRAWSIRHHSSLALHVFASGTINLPCDWMVCKDQFDVALELN